MSDALRFEDVTKSFRPAGYRSLRHELMHRPSVTPRPALDHVSFNVAEGEAYAIIGPNGAGKSTALRMAAAITSPTSGFVRVRGRVGALIEVGAGIHPELTGRENIWLYGAILGLRRAEIAKRFDAIVGFAELGHVLDQPVKQYSSGMQLRLGFSIAAGVEPDILVVDEALAVGDARFQIRCVDRMGELVRSGRTLIYVSHDLASVSTVCTRAMLLIDGRAAYDGLMADTLGAYLDWLDTSGMSAGASARPIVVAAGEPVDLAVPLPLDRSMPITVALGIRDGHPWNVLGASTTVPAGYLGEAVVCRIAALPLAAGVYEIWCVTDGDDAKNADGRWRRIRTLRVTDSADGTTARPLWLPPIAFDHVWE